MIKRRNLLQGLGGVAMAPTFFQTLAAHEAMGGRTASGPIVVCIMLSGGNDGLNTVVPLKQYGAYTKLRSPSPSAPPANLNLVYNQEQLQTLAFDATPANSPGGATSFGFAPGMDAMRLLYAEGRLAVIAGVGLPAAETNPLSHQNGTWDWLTGRINIANSPTTGWLGLALAGAGSGTLNTTTASFGGPVALLNSTTAQALVVNPPMDYFDISYGTSDTYSKLQGIYAQMVSQPPNAAAATYGQTQVQAALADIKTIKGYSKQVPAGNWNLPTYLDYQLRDIARLIAAKAGIRGFYAVQGGYDTHSSQALTQPLLLNQLSNSIAQFYYYLQATGNSSDVVIMTMSDFGRRPYANLSYGTDHGGSSVSFVLGDKVIGGVYGNYPSLTSFDPNGNLKLGVDFRNVLSDLIIHMSGDTTLPAAIIGQSFGQLGFLPHV
jgi:uncharacterized protein (DUF1501 family)